MDDRADIVAYASDVYFKKNREPIACHEFVPYHAKAHDYICESCLWPIEKHLEFIGDE